MKSTTEFACYKYPVMMQTYYMQDHEIDGNIIATPTL